MWVCNEDGEGLGVLSEAIVGVLTEGGLTEAIDGVLTEDGEGEGLGGEGLGVLTEDGEGLVVFRSTKFGFSKANCDPPNRDLVN